MINDFSNFIDKHLQVIRSLTIVTGCVGVVLITRRYHLTQQYQHAKDIPKDFILKNISLHGIITEVKESGDILIRNQPILSIRKNNDSLSIPFLLAGVDLKEGWFDHVNGLRGEKVNFSILENDQKVIKGILFYNLKGFFSTQVCLNEQLIKKGFAVTHCNLAPSSQTHVYHDLIKRLLKQEIKADQKRIGIWSHDRPESIWGRFKNSIKWV